MKSVLLVAATVLLLSSAGETPAAHASEKCSEQKQSSPPVEQNADAGIWNNLRNKKGSIRFESRRLLENCFSKQNSSENLAELCPKQCSLKDTPLVVLRAVPKKFLSKSADEKYCNERLAETKASPFEYHNRVFPSLNRLNDWFVDFSQGNGPDGKDLYKRCDKSCSPQYTVNILRKDDKFTVNAEVLCGPPRDKKDNNYLLSTHYEWQCSAKNGTSSKQ